MAMLLLLGVAMVVVAVWFWYLELRPFLENVYIYRPKGNFIVDFFGKVFSLFRNIGRFFSLGRYFLLDLFVTCFLVSMLGFGDAVAGGILGLTMSNAISVLITVIMRKNARRKSEILRGV